MNSLNNIMFQCKVLLRNLVFLAFKGPLLCHLSHHSPLAASSLSRTCTPCHITVPGTALGAHQKAFFCDIEEEKKTFTIYTAVALIDRALH